MRTIDPATGASVASLTPPLSCALPRDTRGQLDVEAVAGELGTLARSDPAAAQARYAEANTVLSPVGAGELARAMDAQGWKFPIPLPPLPFSLPGGGGGSPFPLPGRPSLPSFPGLPSLPGLPSIPGLPKLPDFPGLPGLPNPIDLGKELLGKVKDLVDALSTLPHAIADKVADSMRGDKARELTPSEKTQIEQAYGDTVDLDKVRIVDGPGDSPIAKAAFELGGNPAITVGNTIYIRHDRYAKDLSTSGNTETLLHEFTHVVQYKEMGYGSFAGKYAADLAKYHGDRNEVYRYDKRDTTYAEETIEGQAQMVGDYAALRNSTDPQDRAKAADIAKRLEGTGIYGL